ncbi:MAG: aconitase family protein [Escherichia coli]
MAIEMGAKAGLVAPDETTFNYVKGRLHAPKGKDSTTPLPTENPANRRRSNFRYRCHSASRDFAAGHPGTNPARYFCERQYSRSGFVCDPVERASAEKALAYGAETVIPLTEVAIDKVFIGSCTNSRIEDLRGSGNAKGRKVAPGVQALWFPAPVRLKPGGSGRSDKFLSKLVLNALAGCSMSGDE